MLHTVNKSPFEKTTFDSCLNHARPGDAILLIEDGVYAAVKGTAVAERVAALNGDLSIYALGPDLSARGIKDTSLIERISVVDYGGFVDLVAEHDVSQAWL
ncbi:MAG: sulfurtransferase complex subunit TusB [Hyphomicrobiaceae bacterium]|nr:sulfurtransferase complex subunit TusB [Hyphomicrobiaceae bacterium]